MSVTIPYVYQYEFEYTKIQTLSPLIRRITARQDTPSGYAAHSMVSSKLELIGQAHTKEKYYVRS